MLSRSEAYRLQNPVIHRNLQNELEQDDHNSLTQGDFIGDEE